MGFDLIEKVKWNGKELFYEELLISLIKVEILLKGIIMNIIGHSHASQDWGIRYQYVSDI